MRHVIVPAVAAAILATSAMVATTGIAHAAAAYGTIRSIDTKAMTMILDDGWSYNLPDDWSNPDVKVGSYVRVQFNIRDHGRQVTGITLK